MTQNPDTKPAEISVSLNSLRIRSHELNNGVLTISREISALEQKLEQLKADRLSTSGAKAFLDKFIAGAEKDAVRKVEETPVYCPPAAAE